MNAPAPRPKYQTVADAIEVHVRKGRWDGGKMPSVRGIADQYGVSIVTASRALQVLRDKGLIQSVERSGTFRLPPASADRFAAVLRVTPGPYFPAILAQTRAGFEAVARRRPMHLHFDAFDMERPMTPADAERAAAQARAQGVQGVFLLPSRASDAAAETDAVFLAGCRAAGLPVVLIERALRGRGGKHDRDLVCLDDTHAAAEMTDHLYDAAGKKRAAIVVASPTSTHDDRVAGYLFAQYRRRAGKKDPAESVIRLPDDLPDAAVSLYLADRVQKDKIDGVVCYQDYIAIGLIVELLSRGIRVPADVAVAGFDNIDAGSVVPFGLTTYDYPVEGMADHAVRLMKERLADPERPPVRVVVPGRLLVRGSTVPADV